LQEDIIKHWGTIFDVFGVSVIFYFFGEHQKISYSSANAVNPAQSRVARGTSAAIPKAAENDSCGPPLVC
jgi:hypothetical protein